MLLPKLLLLFVLLVVLRFPFVILKFIFRVLRPIALVAFGFVLGVVSLAGVPAPGGGAPSRPAATPDYLAAIGSASDRLSDTAFAYFEEAQWEDLQSSFRERLRGYLDEYASPELAKLPDKALR